MANTYVINPPVIQGDFMTVTGTVNGVAVTVGAWVSAAGNALASAIGWENFICPLMLAVYNTQLQTNAPALGSNPITVTR